MRTAVGERARGHLVAVVCLAAFAVTQLGGLVHHLAVQHVRCAAHGDELHAQADAAARAATGPVEAEGDDRLRPGATAAGDGHELCVVPIGLGADGAVAQGRRWEVPAALAAVLVERAAGVTAVARAGVLSLAPKTSPPA